MTPTTLRTPRPSTEQQPFHYHDRHELILAAIDIMERQTLLAREEFGEALSPDPVWAILLHLFQQEMRGGMVTIKSASIYSGAPATTALRHVEQLVSKGFVLRRPHPWDKRSSVLELTAAARQKLLHWCEQSLVFWSRALKIDPWDEG